MGNRPLSINGFTAIKITGCGKLYVTLNFLDADQTKPYEVFVRLGKAGGCAMAQCESSGRLASKLFQYGAEIQEVIGQLGGISCQQSKRDDEDKTKWVLSCSDGIARVLEDHLKKLEGAEKLNSEGK